MYLLSAAVLAARALPQHAFQPTLAGFPADSALSRPPLPQFPLGNPPAPGHGGPDQDLQNWSSLIGIAAAISGNILIAFALNVQRYAHIRLHRYRQDLRERAEQARRRAVSAGRGDSRDASADPGRGGREPGPYGEAARPSSNGHSNGAGDVSKSIGHTHQTQQQQRQEENPYDHHDHHGHVTGHDDAPRETDPLMPSFQRSGNSASPDRSWDGYLSESSGDEDGVLPMAARRKKQRAASAHYLKDPYWWLGLILISVGEMGNFLAYGFAPASIVSPLGVVALIANCVIAPLWFQEAFRARDFWGVIVAVCGAVTVVLSAEGEETKLGPHEVWGAITTRAFEIYMGVDLVLIAMLMWLSPKYGNRTILLDLGLMGLFGGYTALATKGISSMLSTTLVGALTTPITYLLLLVLVVTAVFQVRYVNRALQRFDSTQVIPIQFVMFTLNVIIGSAALYRDFERFTGDQAVKFIGGCLLTFSGVILITSGRPPSQHDDEDALDDVEGIEETIGLYEQQQEEENLLASTLPPATPKTPAHHSYLRHRSGSIPSQRSRRPSRVGFFGTINKPLTALAAEGGTARSTRPPSRNLGPHPKREYGRLSRSSDGEDDSASAMAWRINQTLAAPSTWAVSQRHPGIGAHMVSSDSLFSVTSPAVTDGSASPAPSILGVATSPQVGVAGTEQPQQGSTVATPSPSPASRPYSYHFDGPIISPSPFGSTVSVVVADSMLSGIDHHNSQHRPHYHSHHRSHSGTRRPPTGRRSRPSLYNSLFVPHDEATHHHDPPPRDVRSEPLAATQETSQNEAGIGRREGDAAVAGKEEGDTVARIKGRARRLSVTLVEMLGGKGRRRQGTTATTLSSEENGDDARDGSPTAADTITVATNPPVAPSTAAPPPPPPEDVEDQSRA